MRLTNAEKWILAATLLFLVLTIGYHLGRKRSPAEFAVRTAAEELQRSPDAETPGQPDPAPLPAAGKININTAGKDELRSLSGIGDALSERIIAYRDEHGPFERIEDITKVPGIGSGTFEGLRDQICVD